MSLISDMICKRHCPHILIALALTLLFFNSCKKFEGDITVPAYIHIDRIDVTAQAENAPSVENGFYTSLIDAVQLICHADGDTAETVLGVFQLPCTIPVLRQGTQNYVKVVPVIKQNGIAGSRIQYPFYETLKIENVTLAAEDTTYLGTQEADGLWHLQTHYFAKGLIDILMEDYFEPTSFNIHFDTNVVWMKDDPEYACSGQGYGRVHVPADKQYVAFSIPMEFRPNATQYLYLEMDYWTDTELDLYMTGYEVLGSNRYTKSVMTLYANKGWQKIYINLGKVWSLFNYNVPIALFFQAMNTEGIEGDVRIDNVKLIAL